MPDFKKLVEELKNCKGTGTEYCKKCDYNNKAKCVEELHIQSYHCLKLAYEMADYYSRKVKEEEEECTR